MISPNTVLQERYRITQQLGCGGMGAVYEAIDERLSCVVALKETLTDSPKMRRAFEREAKLLANLRHPALPKVTDHFSDDHGQFLVMEFISGKDLATLLTERRRPFSLVEVLRWADKLLDVLDYLHAHNPPIIHRDIKPANLKLTDQGEIILLDFGLAKGTAGQMSTLRSSRSVLGYTPVYAPLEQIRGIGTDPRSDLYSLAATLYHLMTGALPTDSLTRVDAIAGRGSDPLCSAHRLNPEVPLAVATVIYQAMAISSNQRPATAAEMRQSLLAASLSPAPQENSERQTLLLSPIAVTLYKGEASAASESVLPSQLIVAPNLRAQSTQTFHEPETANGSNSQTEILVPERSSGNVGRSLQQLSSESMFSNKSFKRLLVTISALILLLICLGIFFVRQLMPSQAVTPLSNQTNTSTVQSDNINGSVEVSDKSSNSAKTDSAGNTEDRKQQSPTASTTIEQSPDQATESSQPTDQPTASEETTPEEQPTPDEQPTPEPTPQTPPQDE